MFLNNRSGRRLVLLLTRLAASRSLRLGCRLLTERLFSSELTRIDILETRLNSLLNSRRLSWLRRGFYVRLFWRLFDLVVLAALLLKRRRGGRLGVAMRGRPPIVAIGAVAGVSAGLARLKALAILLLAFAFGAVAWLGSLLGLLLQLQEHLLAFRTPLNIFTTGAATEFVAGLARL